MANNNSKQRLIAIAAVVIVALLGINAFLLYNKYQQDEVIGQQAADLDEAEQLKVELEKQYYESLSELEEMRGSNEELNALIEKQKGELEEQKDRIARLIGNKRDLNRAREEMKGLRAQVDQYLVEINTLREENQLLTDQTIRLSEEKTTLESTLSESQTLNQELSATQATLVNEKAALESEKARLAKKVDIASVVKVGNVIGTGFKSRKSGKAVKKKYAKNIDHVKVCFETTENNVVESGNEQFYIRLISPVGETLAVEEMGSGVMTNSATGEQIRYTQIKDYEYDHDAKTLCMLWAPNVPFQSGNYQVEVYNKGYLAGDGMFNLK